MNQTPNAGALWRIYWESSIQEFTAGAYSRTAQLLGSAVDEAESHGAGPQLVSSLVRLGEVLTELGAYARAETVFQRAASQIEQDPQQYSDMFLGRTKSALGSLYTAWGKYSQALLLHEHAVAVLDNAVPERIEDWIEALVHFADHFAQVGQPERGEVIGLKALALASEHPVTSELIVAGALDAIAMNLWQKPDPVEAVALSTRALEIERRELPEGHPRIARTTAHVARCLWANDDYDEAEQHCRVAIQILIRALGHEHPEVGRCIHLLGDIEAARGNLQLASSYFHEAMRIAEETLESGHIDIIACLYDLAWLNKQQARLAEAEDYYQRAIRLVEDVLGGDSDWALDVTMDLGSLYGDQGRYEDAEYLYRQVLERREAKVGPNHPDVAASLHNLG